MQPSAGLPPPFVRNHWSELLGPHPNRKTGKNSGTGGDAFNQFKLNTVKAEPVAT